jgi:hypothetical protein
MESDRPAGVGPVASNVTPGPSVAQYAAPGKSVSDALNLLAERFHAKKQGANYAARCPAHDDRQASLSFGPGRDKPVFVKCHALDCPANRDGEAALHAVGLDWREVYAEAGRRGQRRRREDWMPCGIRDGQDHDDRHHSVASYAYRDAAGSLIFTVERCALKGSGCQGFRQWRPDPTSKSGKRWSRSLDDGTKVGEGLPYRLPEALQALTAGPLTPNLYVTEGEKDAERLRSLGYVATCNAEGAGKWMQRHADHFRALRPDVVIVADYDPTGWAHADQVATTFVGFARSVEVVHANLTRKGADLSDHLEAGFRMRQLVTIATPLNDPGTDDLMEWR